MNGAPATCAPLPPGDPRKGFWTYADLAAVFGTTRVRRLMPQWDAAGFPAPLPYNRLVKRWHPPAVLAWKARHERRLGARPVGLAIIETREAAP